MNDEAEARIYAFVLMPFDPALDDVYHFAIRSACDAVGVRCGRLDDQISANSDMEKIYEQIRAADLIIVVLSGHNANVMYELGLAHATAKPVVLVARNADEMPFDLRQYPIVAYSRGLGTMRIELEKRLAQVVRQIQTPDDRRTDLSPASVAPAAPVRRIRSEVPPRGEHVGARSDIERTQVFISYSHRDLRWLQRLQVHLRPLERQNRIRQWDDTLLQAGDDWRNEIRNAIAQAKVAILLVSADFIASDFVHRNELPPLLAAAESDGAAILPIIVSASRFEQIQELSRFQAFNSPSRPLAAMTRSRQEEIFAKVAARVEAILSAEKGGLTSR